METDIQAGWEHLLPPTERPDAHSRGVFTHRHVLHVMQPAFEFRVPAVQRRQQVRDSVHRLGLAPLAGLLEVRVARDPRQEARLGAVQRQRAVRDVARAPDSAALDPPEA